MLRQPLSADDSERFGVDADASGPIAFLMPVAGCKKPKTLLLGAEWG